MAGKTRTNRPRTYPEPELEDPSGCLCSGLRRATRAVTQIYDEALEPLELTVSQFCVLAKLEQAAPVTMHELAALLGMDRTTLTRALGPLSREKLTRAVAGEDRRERRIELTAAGALRLKAARPLWLKAQRAVTRAFGTERSSVLLGALEDVRSITASRRGA
jgi:DNA-binding MarR family transcriptional regulator